MKIKIYISTLFIAFLISANANVSPDSAARGFEIARQATERDSGYINYSVEADMTLKSPGGDLGNRKFITHTLEVDHDGDKRLVIFSNPRDLDGFVSLTYAHGVKPDEQWIYLPALRRSKRLAARDKTGAFAGSEFSFEDIATFELDKYDYRYVEDQACGANNEFECFVVDNIPKYQYSGYSNLLEWTDQEIYHPRKIIYFDKAGRELKKLEFHDYKQYEGKFWRPDRVVMTNTQTGAVSEIVWSNYQFVTDLEDSDFASGVIRRWSK